MACVDFVTKSPWTIVHTEGDVVAPFVQGNLVRITEPSEGSYTVAVDQGTQRVGTYPGFICSGSQLDGKVGNDVLRLTVSSGPGRAQINGQWNPTEETLGTWTGDEGGGGGGSDDA